MDKTQEASQTLLNSLQLLEISLAGASRDYGCTLAKDMFTKPNQKGLNTVLHILFERIKGRDSFRKEVKGCWPVKDSVHQREFNKVVHRLVLELSQSGSVPKHLASYLLQGFRQLSGFRLTVLLCYIAASALSADPQLKAKEGIIGKELPSHAQALEPLYLSLRAQTARQSQQYAQSLRAFAAAQAAWEMAVDKLANEYHAALQDSLPQAREEPMGSGGGQENGLTSKETFPQNFDTTAAADSAARLWASVEAGATKQQELEATLQGVIGQAKHPHLIDGGSLLASMGLSGEATTLNLPSVLQDWGASIGNSQESLLELVEIERLEAQNRPVTPLLAPEQQMQVTSISSQHEARLEAQAQLSAALASLLASAVVQREQLLKKVTAATGFMLHQGPRSGGAAKDLIPALRSDSIGSLAAETAMRQLSDMVLSKTSGGHEGDQASKASPGNSKSKLALPAHLPTSFDGSVRTLQLCTANTVPSILKPSAQGAAHAGGFWPIHAVDGSGAICAKASHKHTIEQLWQMRLMGTSYLEQSTRAGQADSCTLPSAQAAPRRLSFSGTTPGVGHVAEEDLHVPSPSSQTAAEGQLASAAPCQEVQELSVDMLLSRMNRLRGLAA